MCPCRKRYMKAVAVTGGLLMLFGFIIIITGALTSTQLLDKATAMILSGGVMLMIGIGFLLTGCLGACACIFDYDTEHQLRQWQASHPNLHTTPMDSSTWHRLYTTTAPDDERDGQRDTSRNLRPSQPNARSREAIPTAPPVADPPAADEAVPSSAPPPSYDSAVGPSVERPQAATTPSTPPPSYDDVVIGHV